ncbi:MAG TPA: fibronectin type III domain-containing protein, partial [Armatimonadota bacterium]|nr:fibronectin type III domain-containing protein [Armatimonadota bacterium]
ENSAFFSGMGGIAIDAAGDVYVTGSTTSTSTGAVPFPTLGPIQAANGGGEDAFLVKISLADPIAQPTGLTATAVSGTQIDLSWTDASINEEGFEVQRKAPGGTFTTVGSVGQNITTFSDTGLAGNTTYTYRVRAYNSTGFSLYSDTAAATTLPDPPAAPGPLTITVLSQTSIRVNWRDNSADETEFRIERKAPGGGFGEVGQTGGNQTTFTDMGLTAGTTYTYRVRAKNSGGFSGYSAEASGTTSPAPPSAPSGLSASAVSFSQVDLSWTDGSNDENAFILERKTGAGAFTVIATLGANVASYSDSGLSGGTAYVYRVKARNAGGDSGYSNEAPVTTPAGPPSAPGGLTATAASQTTINLAWTDNSGSETGFKIERKTTAGGTWAQIQTVGADVTTYADNSLSPNTAYYYRVRATNSQGDSGYSNEANATTLPLPPNAPTGLAFAFTETGVRLTWTDASNNETGFTIERKSGSGSFAPLASVAANVTQYSDNGLAAGTSYSYRVRAKNAGGDSAPSNEVTVSPAGGVLQVKPARLSFGTVRLLASREKRLTLLNKSRTETLRVTVRTVTIPYVVTAGGGTVTLPPRGSASVTVRFTPQVAGTVSRVLTITSSDPAHATVNVTLTGKGR